jgi:hypothetical protein
MTRKAGFFFAVTVVLAGSVLLPAAAAGQDQIEKAKIFRDIYPIVSETDFYCTVFLLEDIPPLRILSAEDGSDKILLTDGDRFLAGPGGGLREGQMFLIVEVGPSLPAAGSKTGRGPVGFRRGRARVVRIDGDRFTARIEKACGPIRAGDVLFPFVEKPDVMGKDLGAGGTLQGGDVLTGRILFLDNELGQMGTNEHALIDIGSEQGLVVGQQMSVFSVPAKGASARSLGNAVVVDAGRTTATIKILSALDAIRAGDLVQIK